MSIWSFYNESGSICPNHYSGPDDYLEANTPKGMRPIAGAYDCDRCKVVHVDDGMGGEVTPVVISCKPPRPADSEFEVWEWSESLDDWEPQPTRAGLARQLRSARNQALLATDAAVQGGIEQLLVRIAVRLGVPVERGLAGLIDYRQRLRDAPSRPDFLALQPSDLAPPAGTD